MRPIEYRFFPTLPSTNDWAKEHIHQLDRRALTAIQAEEQTAGRGRFGRIWHSPKGVNLYLTFVFFTPSQDHDALMLTHLLALTLSDCIPRIPCKLKWPNDVFCSGKKLAGILCETIPYASEQAVILGIGINVNLQDTSQIDQPATSILLETGIRFPINRLQQQLTSSFQIMLCRYLHQGIHPFLESLERLKI